MSEQKVSAGRVLIIPRGEYDETKEYLALDLVNYNGYAYLAKQAVVGIPPIDSNGKIYADYWHCLLDIKKIVQEAIASTVAGEVSELLKDDLSEARYVEDLLAEFDVPTFVHWNSETANTPFTEGLTTITHGYALVEGATVTAWAGGEEYLYSEFGWDKTITSSGGTMSGLLGLGGGKGTVSADEDGAFLEAKGEDDFKQIKVKNDSLEESVKLITKEREFNLFGEHNPNKIMSFGYGKICCGSYVGSGVSGAENPNILTFDEGKPLFVAIFRGDTILQTPNMQMLNGVLKASGIYRADGGEANVTNEVTWGEDFVRWYNPKYPNTENGIEAQQNVSGETYYYIAFVGTGGNV